MQLERKRDAHSAPGAFHFAARLPWAPAAQTAGGQSRPAAPPCCASRAEQSNSNGVAHHRHGTHHTPPRSLCSADCCCLRLQIPPLGLKTGRENPVPTGTESRINRSYTVLIKNRKQEKTRENTAGTGAEAVRGDS